MKKTLLLAVLLLTMPFIFSNAQDNVIITKPKLEFKDNNIIVEYSILNGGSESYNVWLDVTDAEGNKLDANSLSGDVGEQVNGGSDKKIYWNLTADNIYVNALLSVNVNAEVVTEPAVNTHSAESVAKSFKEYTGAGRGSLYLQSLIFPGWGLNRISKGPHWLKGVAGYGCLVTSYVYNTKALNNYSDYVNTTDVVEGNRLYALSARQDKISEGLAIAGATIWVTDLIWTIAGSQKIKNRLQASGISVNPGFEPMANTPVIALTYNF